MLTLTRRSFLCTAAAAGALATVYPTSSILNTGANRFRVAVLGTGQSAVDLVAAVLRHSEMQLHVLASPSRQFLLAISQLLAKQQMRIPKLTTDVVGVYEMPEVEALCLTSDSGHSVDAFRLASSGTKPLLLGHTMPRNKETFEAFFTAVSKARCHVVACSFAGCSSLHQSSHGTWASLRAIGKPISITLRSRAFVPAASQQDFELLVALLEHILALSSRLYDAEWSGIRPAWDGHLAQQAVTALLASHPLLKLVEVDRWSSQRYIGTSLRIHGHFGTVTMNVRPAPHQSALTCSLDQLLTSVRSPSLSVGDLSAKRVMVAAALATRMVSEQNA